MAGSHRYDQKVKAKARRTALKRAVELVTARRDAAAIVPGDYVRRVRRAKRRGSPYDAVHGCHSVGIDHDGFPAAELKRRRHLSRKAGKKRKKG